MILPTRTLLSEAGRDLCAKDLLIAILVIVVLFMSGLSSTSAYFDAFDYETAQAAAGTYVWEISSSPEEPMLADECAALASIDGVAASGGYSTAPLEAYTLEHNGVAVPTVEVLYGSLAVWGDNDGDTRLANGEAILGTDLAHTLNLGAGGSLYRASPDGSMQVGQIRTMLDPDVPNLVLRSAVIVQARSRAEIEGCWVRVRRGSVDDIDAIVLSAFPDHTVSWTQYRLPSIDQTTSQRFASALKRFSAQFQIGLLVLLSAVAGWMRRNDLAVYRALGFGFVSLVGIRQIQTLRFHLPLAVSAALAGMTTQFVIRGMTAETSSLLAIARTPLLVITAWMMVGSVISVLAGWQGIHDVLKDR